MEVIDYSVSYTFPLSVEISSQSFANLVLYVYLIEQ